MMMEDFGARVVSVWEGLRSETRRLIVGALQSPTALKTSNARSGAATTTTAAAATGAFPYDARADWELSRLLAALDERAGEAGTDLNDEQAERLRRMAETCSSVLQSQTQSAEVFAQLVERAHSRRDFARIDALADVLALRFAPSELCELARSGHAVVRALALESLAQAPTHALASLLGDPIDAPVAREALERQAIEYGSEEAHRIVHALNQVDLLEDDA